MNIFDDDHIRALRQVAGAQHEIIIAFEIALDGEHATGSEQSRRAGFAGIDSQDGGGLSL